MTFAIELPSPLDLELQSRAKRAGVTPEERARLLFLLATAFANDGLKTSFREVVRAYLEKSGIDAGRLAHLIDQLVTVCLQGQESTPTNSNGSAVSEQIPGPLRDWRNPAVHDPIASDAQALFLELPPLESLVRQVVRPERPSLLGKYSHLNISSEAFALEKQREIDLEDRVR